VRRRSRSQRARAQTVVEVATIGPGDAVWQRFGHTVLRVVDTRGRRDQAIDLGMADVASPRLFWEFFNARALFYEDVGPWSPRLRAERARDRDVVVQRLALRDEQLARLLAELALFAREDPAQGHYAYDHVRDNCVTRLRDLLDRVSDGALRRAAAGLEDPHTIRELTLRGEAGRLDALIFLDLVLGPPYDRRMAGWDALFRPDQLAGVLARARNGAAPDSPPLVSSTRALNRRRAPPPQTGSPYAGRALVAGLGLGVLALSVGARTVRARFARAFGAAQALAGLVFGLAGLFVWGLIVLARGTDWSWSENALLFLPTDLVWIWEGLQRVRAAAPTASRALRFYLDARIALLLAVVAARAFGLLVQENVAFLVCAAAVLAGLRLARR